MRTARMVVPGGFLSSYILNLEQEQAIHKDQWSESKEALLLKPCSLQPNTREGGTQKNWKLLDNSCSTPAKYHRGEKKEKSVVPLLLTPVKPQCKPRFPPPRLHQVPQQSCQGRVRGQVGSWDFCPWWAVTRPYPHPWSRWRTHEKLGLPHLQPLFPHSPLGGVRGGLMKSPGSNHSTVMRTPRGLGELREWDLPPPPSGKKESPPPQVSTRASGNEDLCPYLTVNRWLLPTPTPAKPVSEKANKIHV